MRYTTKKEFDTSAKKLLEMIVTLEERVVELEKKPVVTAKMDVKQTAKSTTFKK